MLHRSMDKVEVSSTDAHGRCAAMTMDGAKAVETPTETLQWSSLKTSASGDDLMGMTVGSGCSSTCDSATLELCQKLAHTRPMGIDRLRHHNTPM